MANKTELASVHEIEIWLQNVLLDECLWSFNLWPNTTKGTWCLLLRKLRFVHYLTDELTSFPMICSYIYCKNLEFWVGSSQEQITKQIIVLLVFNYFPSGFLENRKVCEDVGNQAKHCPTNTEAAFVYDTKYLL